MTTKERRLVFTYSRLCSIGNELNHCISLLSCHEYDKDVAEDERVKAIRNKLSDVELEFEEARCDLERIVNGMTDYGETKKIMKTTDAKECYGDHFKCDECNLVKSGWKSACKRQCEYNWEHRNSHIARPSHDDGNDWDIAGQYQTSY